MNRELEFRYWDENTKKFYYFHMSEAITAGLMEHRPNISIPRNKILEQNTGIVDKNGISIYEGDIIRNNQFKPVQVYYDIYIGGYYPFYLRLDVERQVLANNPEIIGNIYETPELVK